MVLFCKPRMMPDLTLEPMPLLNHSVACYFILFIFFEVYYYFYFFKCILLIMLLQLSHSPLFIPLHPAHPLPPAFPPL